MGSIHFEGAQMFGSLSDSLGVKSGLALTDAEIREILRRADGHGFEDFVDVEPEEWVRVESVLYESMFEYLLFAVGRLKKPNNVPGTIALYHKYKTRPKQLKVVYKLSGAFTDFLNKALKDPTLGPGQRDQPHPGSMLKAIEEHGHLGLEIAEHLVESLNISAHH